MGWGTRMDCVACGSAAVTERSERTAQGYRRFRCRECGKQYNERSGGVLNYTHYPRLFNAVECGGGQGGNRRHRWQRGGGPAGVSFGGWP